MTRHVIAYEGKPSILPDVWLEKDSLWIDPNQIVYVTANFDWASPPIGRATDLQRDEETGEVTVDIQLFDGTEIDKQLYECSFWANELEERKIPATDDHAEYRLVLKAKIRGISIVPTGHAIPRDSQKTQAP